MKIKGLKPKFHLIGFKDNCFYLIDNPSKCFPSIWSLLEENKGRFVKLTYVNGSKFNKCENYKVVEKQGGGVEVKSKSGKTFFPFNSLQELKIFFESCRPYILRTFKLNFIEYRYESKQLVHSIMDNLDRENLKANGNAPVIFGYNKKPDEGFISPVGKLKPVSNPRPNSCNFKLGDKICGRPTYANEDKCNIHL